MSTKTKVRLSIILYLFTAIIRLYQLNLTAVYPDEITWMVKGKEFLYSIAKRNLEYFHGAWWNSTKDSYAIGIPVIVPSGLMYTSLAGSGKYSLKILPDIIASRLPIVFIGSLTAVLIFLFGLNYFTPAVSLITGLLYAINPITISLDRWILNDSFLTLFSFLSITSFYKSYNKSKSVLLPGVFLGLAFLVKPNGLLPFVAWLIFLLFGKNRRFTFKLIILNVVSFLFIVGALWPQVWISGPFAIIEYLSRQSRLVNSGDPIPNYFFGHATLNPNPMYYFFQLFTRLPEIIVILFISSAIFYFKRSRPNKTNILIPSVIIYSGIFLLLVSFSSVKGGVRYVLPLFPWIYLSCGWVINNIDISKYQYKEFVKFVIITLSCLPLLYFPNYYLYYNSFINGPKTASKFDLFGLCFGSKEALEYLDANHINGLTSVIGCADTAPYHSGRPLTKKLSDASIIIIENSFVQQHPDSSFLKFVNNKKLIQEITQQGVVTARIYH